jgi:2-dehydro-3-deoxyphosphogluconate aldolase/(4S)-4-hydroxy-2-oxoglutarate aldolase
MAKDIQKGLEQILRKSSVIPVIVIDEVKQAVPLARALVAGGLPVLEVTLRTPAAVDAIKAIKAEVEEAVVGAGTVLSAQQLKQVAKLGCAFAVSPGSAPKLLDAAKTTAMPLLPGAVTATEILSHLERGFRFQKFFPAEPAGGPTALFAMAAPFPDVKFVPTGGIIPDTAPRYLALSNVIAVGGSWMVSRAAINSGDWARIEVLAKRASTLRG